MSVVFQERNRVRKEIGNIISNGKLIESEIYYNGAHNSNMNTSAVYELNGKYYCVTETYNPDTYEYEEDYYDITEEYSKVVEESERLSKAISNITTNGEHVAINEDGDYIHKLNDRYYVVYTYFNSDLYNYEEDYCDITDDYSKIVAE